MNFVPGSGQFLGQVENPIAFRGSRPEPDCIDHVENCARIGPLIAGYCGGWFAGSPRVEVSQAASAANSELTPADPTTLRPGEPSQAAHRPDPTQQSQRARRCQFDHAGPSRNPYCRNAVLGAPPNRTAATNWPDCNHCDAFVMMR